MTGFYAMGGGLGHLTRVQTFIKNYQISGAIKIITANRSVLDFFSKEQVVLVESDKSTTPLNLADQIKAVTSHLDFEKLYIDTFPCGIMGELNTDLIPSKTRHLLARRLIWKNYLPLISEIIPFDSTYYFEPLHTDHQQFIKVNSKLTIEATLDYQIDANRVVNKRAKPLWLIVHSTYQEELQLLIHHAQDIAKLERIDPEFLVLSDVTLPSHHSYRLLRNENPLDWYYTADRIFTGGGFNTWHQLKPWRVKHVALPFKRKFDDQFWRVRELS